MDGILSRHGFRVAVMKADAVAPKRREAWVAEQMEKGIDVPETGADRLRPGPSASAGRCGWSSWPTGTACRPTP